MEHNDPTDKDLPRDPDATEIVPVDLEAMLHMELDAEKAAKRTSISRLPSPRPAAGRPPKESIATVRAMRAAPRASVRMAASSASMPASRSRIPRPPIHTLLPPPDLEVDEDDTTRVFDRTPERALSARASMPSVKSVAFPAPAFSAPRAPQPFHTVPAIPAAKRVSPPASESQPTPVQPVLAPTSRRDLRLSAFESLAPMAMSAFPSAPPPTRERTSMGATLALVAMMVFAIASAGVIGVRVFKPNALDGARIAIVGALKGNQKHPSPITAAEQPAESTPPPAVVSVPPVLIDDVPSDLEPNQTAIFLPESAKGHRIFVDGRALNEGDVRYVVASCGKHKVQIGSTGKEQTLDLPCGGVSHPE